MAVDPVDLRSQPERQQGHCVRPLLLRASAAVALPEAQARIKLAAALTFTLRRLAQ